jgi:predicted glycosyltransferase
LRILIDILHPAHVHFFKNFHAEMRSRGHALHVTARAKECSTELLERYELPFDRISVQRAGSVGLATELVQRTYRLSRVVRRFRPDVLTGIMGPSIALTGALQRVRAVVFYDTEFARQTNWFTYPLAHSVCTPDCYQGKVRGVHRRYAGYHELAYLHPKRFTPNPTKLRVFGLMEGEPYTIVRFVHWKAVHDRRERGLMLEEKRSLVEMLERYGRVMLSSEGPLPADLEPRRARGPVEDIHHLLAFAQMVVGESATMSSEAAVLGVPAVFIATTGRGYTDEQEQRYGLVRHFTEDRYQDAERAIECLFSEGSPRERARESRARLLAEKIDVTEWMVRYFEESFGVSKGEGGRRR